MSYLAKFSRPRLIGLSIGLAIVLFFAINVVAGNALRTARADLTENALYSLSDGTKRLLKDLKEPLHMRFFLSDNLVQSAPQLATYAKRVRAVLDTYASLANGKITLEVINPRPFSYEEDRAVGLGINRIRLAGASDPLFFGLAVTNSTDGKANIPVFAPEREAFLEYDLTRLVARLGQRNKPVVAVLDGLQLAGNVMAQLGKQVALSQIEEIYDVKFVTGDADKLPDNTKVVMVVHPQDLSDRTLFTLDQWVLRGGATMVFVDPYAETQQGPRPGMPPAKASSDLKKLFEAWGVGFDVKQAVADPTSAIRTVRRIGGRQVEVANYPWISVRRGGMDTSNAVFSQLSSIIVSTAGNFTTKRDDITLKPLLTASPSAGFVDAVKAGSPYGDPRELQALIKKSDKPIVLAARLDGKLKTAFPNGKPKGSKAKGQALKALSGRANVILVADADMLADRNWIQHRELLGQRIVQAFANNGDFVLNAIEQMVGGITLADLRGRGVSWRPFERILAIQKEAEGKFRAKEQKLAKRVESLQKEIRELHSGTNKKGDFASEKTVQAIERSRADLLEARAELRHVQHDLRRDVEQLQTWVTTVNVGLFPAIVAACALGFALRRPRRKVPVKTGQTA